MRPIYRTGVKLPSRCPILYLFNKYPYWICCIISIFFSSKCPLFHNATLFGFCITHILNTAVLKLKKIRRKKVKWGVQHVALESQSKYKQNKSYTLSWYLLLNGQFGWEEGKGARCAEQINLIMISEWEIWALTYAE